MYYVLRAILLLKLGKTAIPTYYLLFHLIFTPPQNEYHSLRNTGLFYLTVFGLKILRANIFVQNNISPSSSCGVVFETNEKFHYFCVEWKLNYQLPHIIYILGLEERNRVEF